MSLEEIVWFCDAHISAAETAMEDAETYAEAAYQRGVMDALRSIRDGIVVPA